MWIRKAKLKTLIADEVEKSSRQLIPVLDFQQAEEQGAKQEVDGEVIYDSYEKVSWIRASVDVITRSVVSRGYTFVESDDNEKSTQEDLERLNGFFGNCNPQDTFEELLEDVVRDNLLIGNGFFEKAKTVGGDLGELWVIDAVYMKVQVDKHGRVLGYIYEAPGKGKVKFKEDEVVHFRTATRGSKPYGMSKIIALTNSIVMDRNARKYNKAFFRRGGKVRGLIIMKNATYEQITRNREFLKKIAKDPELAQGDLLLEGDADYKPIAVKPSEISFLELLKFSRDEILAVYGCPPSKVSLIETGNIGSGSGESQDKTFYEETIEPLQNKTQAKITKKIIREGLNIKGWDFKLKRRVVNTKEQSEIHETYITTEVMDTEEVREELELPPRTKKSLGEEAEKKITPSESVISYTDRIVEMENLFEANMRSYFHSIRDRILEKLPNLKLASFRSRLKDQPVEQRFATKQYSDYTFNVHKFPVITKQLEGLEELLEVIDPKELEQMLSRNLRRVGDAGGSIAGKRLEIPDFKYQMSPNLVAQLAVISGELSGYLAKELQDNIQVAILEGLQRGESIPQLRNRIEASLEKTPPISIRPVRDPQTGDVIRRAHERVLSVPTRAKMIARTETNRVVNQGALDAYVQAEVVQKVELINPGACPVCEPFVGESYDLDQARSILPIHHNCRCTWAPVVLGQAKIPVERAKSEQETTNEKTEQSDPSEDKVARETNADTTQNS